MGSKTGFTRALLARAASAGAGGTQTPLATARSCRHLRARWRQMTPALGLLHMFCSEGGLFYLFFFFGDSTEAASARWK